MKLVVSILLLFSLLEIHAQFGAQQIITETADGTRIVFATDINGDGFVDILSANKFGSSITLYKNMDGSGYEWSETVIATLNQTISVFGADLTGSGYMDVLAVSGPDNRVVWYENLDGQGNFGSQRILDFNAEGAFSVIAADLDADGDLDVISASSYSGLAWYENLDGNGTFSQKKIIANQLGSSRSVVAVDLDGDGDLDILGNATGADKIFWIENLDGLGTFGTRQIIDSTGLYANVVFAADIDGDGDMDVLFASNGDNEVAWYENLDGLGNFGTKRTITNTLHKAWTVYAADLDNDGDIDVLATSVETFGGEIVWFENLDGHGNFSTKKIISTEVQSPRSVIAADINGDGALDVVSSSQNDDKVAWYRNLILGVDDKSRPVLNIYPNPTEGKLFIDMPSNKMSQILVFDILGKNVLQLAGNNREIDISSFQNGLYILKISTEDGNIVQRIIKKGSVR